MNWHFWLELLVRSGVLLLGGEALRRASKAQSPEFRHSLILWVLGLLVLLPVLSVVFPEIHVPLWKTAESDGALVNVEDTSTVLTRQSSAEPMNWAALVWLAGAFAAFMPVVSGSVSVWRLERRATSFPYSGSEGVPEILLSDQISTPLTCGILRPRILLPTAATHWNRARLTAVLRHESAHARRRDVLIQMVTHSIAALWWFQPLVWMARRRLREESELACDSEVIRAGFRPSEYAAELVAVAKCLTLDPRLSSPVAISMASGHDLEARVKAILNPYPAPRSRFRTAVLGVCLGAVAFSASAITSNQQGGSNMKSTILSAVVTAVGMSAATVSGSIHDAKGAAVWDAKVVLTNPETGVKQETTTGADGRFILTESESGPYILRIEKAGLGSILREFDLAADTAINRDFKIGSNETANESEEHQGIHVGGEVAQNNLTTKVQPVYPPTAKAAGTQGTVEMEATISKEGVPLELRIISSPGEDLSESALEAVRQWRYRPTLLNGQPVEIVTDVMINYTLAK